MSAGFINYIARNCLVFVHNQCTNHARYFYLSAGIGLIKTIAGQSAVFVRHKLAVRLGYFENNPSQRLARKTILFLNNQIACRFVKELQFIGLVVFNFNSFRSIV